MNVASLELCKELHELSGWEFDTGYYWLDSDKAVLVNDQTTHDTAAPAYDLGYLLRKLRITADWIHGRFYLENCCEDGRYYWTATYNSLSPDFPHCEANSPEDAACKLTIELFKQKVLTKEIQSS